MISPIIHKRRLVGVFYAVNGLGLGHLSRQLTISEQLRGQFSKLKISFQPFFITTSEGAFLLRQYQIPFLQLPGKNIMRASRLLEPKNYARMIHSSVNNTLDFLQPDLLVVDTFPLGSCFELGHYLISGKAKKIFIHRARKKNAYDVSEIVAQSQYDLIIAPHYKSEVEIPLPENCKTPLFWSGPIFNAGVKKSKARLRSELGLKNQDMVCYVTLGGGGDVQARRRLFEVYEILQKRKIKVVFGHGPLAGRSDSKLMPSSVYNLFDYPASSYFPAFDFAISAAGYNSFYELLYHGVPTIFLPQYRGLDNQLERAQGAFSRSACYLVDDFSDFGFKNKISAAVDELLLAENRRILARAARKYVPENHSKELANEIIALIR